MLIRLVAIAAISSLMGCDLPKDQVHEDAGRVCVQGEGTSRTVPVDAPSEVIVTLECASACAEDVRAECAIRQEGTDLIVESLFSYNESADICIEVCAEIDATCELPSLPVGTYTLRHGAEQQALVIGESAPQCF